MITHGNYKGHIGKHNPVSKCVRHLNTPQTPIAQWVAIALTRVPTRESHFFQPAVAKLSQAGSKRNHSRTQAAEAGGELSYAECHLKSISNLRGERQCRGRGALRRTKRSCRRGRSRWAPWSGHRLQYFMIKETYCTLLSYKKHNAPRRRRPLLSCTASMRSPAPKSSAEYRNCSGESAASVTTGVAPNSRIHASGSARGSALTVAMAHQIISLNIAQNPHTKGCLS